MHVLFNQMLVQILVKIMGVWDVGREEVEESVTAEPTLSSQQSGMPSQPAQQQQAPEVTDEPDTAGRWLEWPTRPL